MLAVRMPRARGEKDCIQVMPMELVTMRSNDRYSTCNEPIGHEQLRDEIHIKLTETSTSRAGSAFFGN